ncbi:MAG: ABC transporter permease [bacterium]|nr:ABC transporter permease [bacterium]
MRLKAIALNTFKEAVRNKVFYLLIAFGILSALSSKIVSMLTIGDEVKVLKDVGLASVSFFSVLIAVFTGINLIFKEIDKKTIYNILSKPISRSNFILGKFIGLSFTLLVALASMALIFFLFLFLATGEAPLNVLLYFVFLYMELLILTAVSILFSSFSTPILSSIFTIALYLIGQVLWTFNLFKERLATLPEKIIAHFIYYLLPNLDKYNIKGMVVMKETIDSGMVLDAITYAVVYISAVLLAAILIFNKKEFQ